MDWQTIDTAPKDGTRVLVWADGWDAPSTAQWIGDRWSVGYSVGYDVVPFGRQPTHWMPVPKAPVEDLIEDLRDWAAVCNNAGKKDLAEALHAAADRIEKLQAESLELKAKIKSTTTASEAAWEADYRR